MNNKRKTLKSSFYWYLSKHIQFQELPEGRLMFTIITHDINDMLSPYPGVAKSAEVYINDCPHWELLGGNKEWLSKQVKMFMKEYKKT